MPVYFFGVRESGRTVEHDYVGTDLPNVAAALAHAERKIKLLQAKDAYRNPVLIMIVEDEARRMVLSPPVSSERVLSGVRGIE